MLGTVPRILILPTFAPFTPPSEFLEGARLQGFSYLRGPTMPAPKEAGQCQRGKKITEEEEEEWKSGMRQRKGNRSREGAKQSFYVPGPIPQNYISICKN